jgi:hypothetical protein
MSPQARKTFLDGLAQYNVIPPANHSALILHPTILNVAWRVGAETSGMIMLSPDSI